MAKRFIIIEVSILLEYFSSVLIELIIKSGKSKLPEGQNKIHSKQYKLRDFRAGWALPAADAMGDDDLPYRIRALPAADTYDSVFCGDPGDDVLQEERHAAAPTSSGSCKGIRGLAEHLPRCILAGLPSGTNPAEHQGKLGAIAEDASSSVRAAAVEVHSCSMPELLKAFAVQTALDSSALTCNDDGNDPDQRASKGRRSTFVRVRLESLLGGPWVCILGHDFGCCLTGMEFCSGTLIHLTIRGSCEGYLIFQPRITS